MPDAAPTVLMVSVQWPPETFIERIAKGLSASGVKVQLAVNVRPGQRAHWTDGGALEVVELPNWNRGRLRRAAVLVGLFTRKLTAYPFGVVRLAQVIARTEIHGRSSRMEQWYRLLPFVGLKPSLVHFQWNSSAFEFEPLGDLFRCPTIISCRGSQVMVAPHDPARRESIVDRLRRTLGKATRVHCVSEDIRQVTLGFGVEAERTEVIRPAVDPDVFTPHRGAAGRIPGAPLRVVTIGSLIWRKGHEWALMAMRHLLDAGVPVQFDICGDGPDRQSIEYTINDLGIEHLVRLRGQLSPQQCRDVLQTADVFLLSSVAEGISNAVLEAMACGLPVVSTDCGGLREAVRDNVDGFLVGPRDPVAMARALQNLASDEGLRRQMGANARQRVLEGFTLDRQVAGFRQLYAAAIGAAQ